MISAISSGISGYDAASIQQIRSNAADRILKEVDTNQDGKITKDELGTAIAAQGNKQGPNVAEVFKQLDQGAKGYITKQDLESALAKTDQAQSTEAKPAPRAGGGGGGGGGADSSSTSTTTTYDPMDLNQDGTVTMQEKIQYALNLYAAQKTTQSSAQNTSVLA